MWVLLFTGMYALQITGRVYLPKCKADMEKSPHSQSTVDTITLNEFMNSLQRLFKIGIYYPSGHVILDKATDRFMKQIAEVAGDNKAVKMQVFNTTIILEGIQLDPAQPFVRDFNVMLSTLGVSTLSIDKQITMRELHDFIRKMLAYKAKIINAKQFTQVEVTDLPISITIEQQEFLARGGSPERSAESTENLETFVESLANYGLNDTEIQQCRTLLDSLPKQLSRSNIDLADLPYASWDDVALLLSRAIRGGKGVDKDGKITLASQSNINALASILKKLELETQDKKAREAINLLVSVIKKPLPGKEKGSPIEIELVKKAFPKNPSIDITELQEFTNTQKVNPKVLAKIPDSTTDTETLSILLQLARYEQPIANQIRMQQFARETLSGRFSEKIWEILSGGLHTIAVDGNINRLAPTLRLIIEPLRHSKYGNTLQLFQLIIKLCGEKENRLIWPFLVNELLVEGSSKDKIVYHQLCQHAARIAHSHMVAALPQLKDLEAFQEYKIASDIFHAVSPSCYPLFAFLFKTEIERYIGERVIGGLRRNPRDWLIKAVAPMLDLNQQEHKLFLYSYLRQASQKVITEPLKKAATQIITTVLPALSQDRRNEQWIEGTITAMAQLPADSTNEVLREISGKKKLLFIPEWPSPCRKAAEVALKTAMRKY